MSMETCRERIVARIVTVVQTFFAAAREWPKGKKLYAAEQTAWRVMREVARVLLQGWVDSQHGGHCGPRQTDDEGTEREFKQYLPKTVQTLVGPVEVCSAHYYAKEAEPKSVFPLREELGIPAGEYSEGMEEVVALGCSEGVYRTSLVLVNRLTGAEISVHKAEDIVRRWGDQAKSRVLADRAAPETPVERIAATRPIEGTRECITLDGTTVQTTTGWRDVKLIAGYAFDGQGRKEGPASYAGTLHYEKDFGELLWHVMEERGASRATDLVWLGDGAPWIWNQQQTVAPHAVPIVDFYHASDRLWNVGRAIHGDTPQAKVWSKKWITNLYKGKVPALLGELAAHTAARGQPPKDCATDDPRKVLADAHRYFNNNAGRMRYAEYRAKGYPIGSGVVESSCRHIVGLRMKRTATMEWTEPNAEAMVQLRCLSAGGDWDRFWGFDQLWQHIRRLTI